MSSFTRRIQKAARNGATKGRGSRLGITNLKAADLLARLKREARYHE